MGAAEARQRQLRARKGDGAGWWAGAGGVFSEAAHLRSPAELTPATAALDDAPLSMVALRPSPEPPPEPPPGLLACATAPGKPPPPREERRLAEEGEPGPSGRGGVEGPPNSGCAPG